MLLAGVETVPWAQLTVTFGSAREVPSWLRQLTSPSPKVRRSAMWWLSEAFVHQGTVWTAAAAAVPFLIELVGAPEVGNKDSMLILLDYIAEGFYHSINYSALDDDPPTQDEATACATNAGAAGETEKGDAADQDDDRHQPQRAAIRAGVPIYLTLLDDPDLAVRVAAARLLLRCRSAAVDPRPWLETARGREANPGVAAGLLLALGQLCRESDERAAFFTEAMRAPGLSRVERVVAALALMEAMRETVPDEAIDLLVAALAHPSRRLDAEYRLATSEGWLARRIGLLMHDLPAARLARAVASLSATLPRIGRERQRAAASLLLAARFPRSEGARLPSDSLTREQRAALEALFAAEPYWRDGALSLVSLRSRGLPDTRPALADYLELDLPPEHALGAVEHPRPHRPPPFTLKAYEARINNVYGYLHLRRKRGYRFEPGAEVDLYSPNGFQLFYFPKTPEVLLAMEREVAVGDSLPRLPLRRFRPNSGSRDTRALGRVFMEGWHPQGKPLTPEALERLRGKQRWAQFATLLARFLRELHATPLDRMPSWLPPAEGRESWERMYAEVRARLFDYVPRDARQRITDLLEMFLAEPSNWVWAPTVVHGDFAPRNILCSVYSDGDAAMSGIQGWGRAGLGDPAADLATLLGPDGYGEEFVLHFADAYPSLEEELPRARFYASVRPLREALATAQGREKEAAARILTHYLP